MKRLDGYVDSAREKLHSSFYFPDEDNGEVALICDPLCEERRCALRTSVRLAERLAKAGVVAVRFDYSGTGDSTGAFADMSAEQWIGDIRSIAEECLQHGKRLRIIAMRASALLAAAAGVSCAQLTLLAPLKSGKEYLHQLELRNRLKAEVGGTSQSNSRDFGGFVISENNYAQLEALDLEMLCAALPGECQLDVVMVGAGKALPATWKGIAQRAANVSFVYDLPFWGQTDYFESENVIQAIVQK